MTCVHGTWYIAGQSSKLLVHDYIRLKFRSSQWHQLSERSISVGNSQTTVRSVRSSRPQRRITLTASLSFASLNLSYCAQIYLHDGCALPRQRNSPGRLAPPSPRLSVLRSSCLQQKPLSLSTLASVPLNRTNRWLMSATRLQPRAPTERTRIK